MTDDPADVTSDSDLLAAHVAGDPEAFAILFSRHRDRLWAVAVRTMGNPHDAADGLQDGLVAAYRRAGTFRGDAAVTTWLHRVVVNACLDRLRAAKVRRTEAFPEELDDRGGRGAPAYSSTSRSTDPEQSAIVADRRRAVLAALATLPDEQRAALVLVDMEGYSVAEVAVILDCAEGTVKSRCSRGRSRLAVVLRDRLADLDPPPDPREPGHPEPDAPRDRPIPESPRAGHPTPTAEGGAP